MAMPLNESPIEPRQEPVEKPAPTFRPIEDRILVRPLELTVTEGGVFLPETLHSNKPTKGEVIAAGPGRRDETGEMIPMEAHAGDTVLFAQWAGSEVSIDGVSLLILRQSDIFGVFDENE